MYQFVNSFSCASSSEENKVLIYLRQRCPSFDKDGDLGEAESASITSVIMDTDVARKLGEMLCTLTEDDPSEDDIIKLSKEE